MLRVQRVCGRSREGAAVPLCVKLQGAVQCGKPQLQLNGTGYIHLNDSLEMSSSSGSWLKLSDKGMTNRLKTHSLLCTQWVCGLCTHTLCCAVHSN